MREVPETGAVVSSTSGPGASTTIRSTIVGDHPAGAAARAPYAGVGTRPNVYAGSWWPPRASDDAAAPANPLGSPVRNDADGCTIDPKTAAQAKNAATAEPAKKPLEVGEASGCGSARRARP